MLSSNRLVTSLFLLFLFLMSFTLAVQSTQVKWMFPTSQTQSDPVSDFDSIYSVTSGGTVFSIDKTTGRRNWAHQLETEVLVKPLLTDNRLFIGAENGLYAIDKTGTPRGFIETTSPILTPPLSFQSSIIAITKSGEILVINPAGELSNSKIIRKIILPEETQSSAVVHGVNLFLFSTEGRLYSINPLSGAITELLDTGRTIWRSMPVAFGDMIYVSADRFVMAFKTSGNLNWSKEIGGLGYSPTLSGDKLYVGSNDGNLYVLNAVFGDIVWKFKTNDSIRTQPVVTNNTVYVSSNDHSVYSISLRNRTANWINQLDDWPSTPILSDGRLHVSTFNGSIYTISTFGCSINFPEANSTVFARASLAGTAYADEGIESVELRSVPGSWEQAPAMESWDSLLQIFGLAEGQIAIQCRASDKAGNVDVQPYSETNYNFVFSEDKLPIINATYPEGASVNTPFVIKFTTEDGAPMSGLSVSISGEKYKVNDSTGIFSYTPDKEGTLDFFIEKPNFQTKIISVMSSQPLFTLPVVGGIFIVIAIIVWYIFFRRRRPTY